MQTLQHTIAGVIQDVFAINMQPILTRTSEQFGDYATNVALQLAGQVGRGPREIAEELAGKLRVALGEQVREVTIAGPGFINITLSDAALAGMPLSAPT
ncbi:MAG: hypothetical protein AAB834_00970, partial [Patescibacteria group bacterium]